MRLFPSFPALALAASGLACQRVPEAGPQTRGAALETPPAVTSASESAQAVTPPPAADAPFALVELFTSEGCSSCPPADEHLASIAERVERTGEHVYTLELHVDYWDSPSWTDPFSAPAYSERQRAYAVSFGLSELFTPQLVVNGKKQLIGTHRAEADAAIAEALRAPARVHVEASARPGKARGEIQVSYDVLGCPSACTLAVALVQDRAETTVLGGENRARKLEHRHVVRALYTRALAGDGRGTILTAWHGAASAPGLAIAFVSDTASGAILGARSVSLAPS